jgi:hypothetical protein
MNVSLSYASQVYSQTAQPGQPKGYWSKVNGEGDSYANIGSVQSQDQVSISRQGARLGQAQQQAVQGREQKGRKESLGQNQANVPKGPDQQPLASEEIRQLQQLQSRDTEVRAHEQAHLAAAGQYAAGGASFSYQNGPDGKRYAVGGEVPIDISKERTPEATIQKMRTVKRAALAPASPSSTDRQIAAQAGRQEARAFQEMQTEAREERTAKAAPSSQEAIDTENQDSLNPRKNNPTTDSPQQPTSQAAPKPQVGNEYSRRVMDSAYKAMAALA